MAEVAPLVLVAASLLSIPARRIRALARGDRDALRDWIANESATRLAEARRDARAVLRALESASARVVTMTDSGYPRALLDLGDPPPFLIVRGVLPHAPEGGAGVAIVGTREASPAGAAFAFDLARSLHGPVVSGLATGIDAAAHRGAIAAGVATVAYVAHGIGATFPPEHDRLEVEILAARGAIASEHLPGTRVSRWSLVRRDRLQAAHARATVIVESEADGGAMQTMRFACDLGRGRFAASPAASGAPDRRDAGARAAIAAGATVLASDPADAAAWLNAWVRRQAPASPALGDER